MARAQQQRKSANWAFIILGTLMVLCAIGLCAWPGLVLEWMAIWAGIAFLVAGTGDLATFIGGSDGRPRSGWTLLSAIVDLIAGAFLLLHPLVSGAVLADMVGFVFIILGVVEVVGGVKLGQDMGISPVPMAVSGVLRALCGVMFVVWPTLFGVFVAAALLFRGIAFIIQGAITR